MLFKGPYHRAVVYGARAAAVALCGCAGVARASVAAAPYQPLPFEHYQPILDRMPFGAAAPAAAPSSDLTAQVTDAQTQALQQKLAQQINMSCINVTPDGTTAIGFTDLAAKPPANYYLLVGASAGGWSVVKADYDDEWAQIEKEGVTITLKLGKGLIEAPPVRAPAAAVAHAPAATPAPDAHPAAEAAPALRPGLIRRPSQPNMPPIPGLVTAAQRTELLQTREEIAKLKEKGGDVGSYMERFRERIRQESEAKAAAEQAAREKLQELARKITKEELTKREREMNLNLIEQGARPISNIELTPEEDAALVEKGVLGEVR